MRVCSDQIRGAPRSTGAHAFDPSSRRDPYTSPLGRSAAQSSAASESAVVRASFQVSPFPLETCSTCPPGRTAQATSTPERSSPVTRATRVTPRIDSTRRKVAV